MTRLQCDFSTRWLLLFVALAVLLSEGAFAQVTVTDFPAPPYTMGETYTVVFDYDGSLGPSTRIAVAALDDGGDFIGLISESFSSAGAQDDVSLAFTIPQTDRAIEEIRVVSYLDMFLDVPRIDLTQEDLLIQQGVTGTFNSGPVPNNGFNLYGDTDRNLTTRAIDLSGRTDPQLRFNFWALDASIGMGGEPAVIPRLEYSVDGCASFQALDYTTPSNGSTFPDHFLYQSAFPYVVTIPAGLAQQTAVHLRWMQPENNGENTDRWQLYEPRIQSSGWTPVDLNIDSQAGSNLVSRAPLGFMTSEGSLSYCTIPVGLTSDARTITLTNTGSEQLVFPPLEPTGDNDADFVINNDNCSSQVIESLDSCTFDVHFAPTSTGQRIADVVIDAGAPNNPLVVSLMGNGAVVPLTFDVEDLDFGDVRVGSSAMQSVSIENTSEASRTLDVLSIGGDDAGDFDFVENHCDGVQLAVGDSCSVTLSMMPSETGLRSALLNVPSNAATGPDSITLSGNGVEADITLAPISLDFGTLAPDATTATQSFTISNTGTAVITLSELVAPDAPFVLAGDDCGDLPAQLEPGEQCTVDIQLTPGSEFGTFSASVGVTHDVAGGPDSVTLSVSLTAPASSPQAIPSLGRLGIMLLALMLLVLSASRLRRSAD